MSDTVIKVMPAMCRNRGCKRPVYANAVRALAEHHATYHQLVDPTFCVHCNEDFLQQGRRNPDEPPVLDMGDYFDEDRTVWPRGSY